MQRESGIKNYAKWGRLLVIVSLSLILNSLFLIPNSVQAQGILPTPGETCEDDTCRKAICPQGRLCEQGKCITQNPPGNVAQETLPCNYTLDELLLTGINMAKFIFVITGALMLMFIAYGGFTLFTSVGNPEEIMKGRKILTAAFIGVILIFGATILVQFAANLIGVRFRESPGSALQKTPGVCLPGTTCPPGLNRGLPPPSCLSSAESPLVYCEVSQQ